jgi:hypothetical protein
MLSNNVAIFLSFAAGYCYPEYKVVILIRIILPRLYQHDHKAYGPMESKPNTIYDKFNFWIRNNPVVSALMVVGVIIVALSTFTNAAKNLLSVVVKENRPEINGEWTAEITYDWSDRKFTETFTFGGEKEAVHGTASFLGVKRGIVEGNVVKGQLEFVTKTQAFSGDFDNQKEVVHRYLGKIVENEIQFVLQMEGGFSTNVPLEFTASKVQP